jgi:pentatricopeptide repeat protein
MQQEGLRPNEFTLVAILNACSHAGLVEEALDCFHSMQTKFNIAPTTRHCTCVVDALGRAGRLQEAEQFLTTMKKPDAVAWKSLLGACRKHGDVDTAERAAQSALKLNAKDSSIYVLLSNIYSSKGRFEDANRVRTLMKEREVKKTPGQTTIEIDGQVHTFVVNDQSHPQTSAIYAELTKLFAEMKQAGYIPDTNFALHDVEEEQKEHLLSYHSEKLAIAFGMISTPPNSRLVIVKNLRVCGDCHTATKYISKLRNREIIVRDANRFHHFRNGTCSCQDYF